MRACVCFVVAYRRALHYKQHSFVVRGRAAGTTVHFRPGTITGGRFEHNCGVERSITYFLEPLLLLAPFGKVDMAATLHGVRACSGVLSVCAHGRGMCCV